MDNRLKIGVVTVTYNSAGVIDDFLNSLLAQSYSNFEAWIVDNASSDATLQRVKSCADSRIVVIANSNNAGIASGNNQGIRAALQTGCDLVLLINNDTEFGADLLETLCGGLRDQAWDMIVPKIMYFEDPSKIWCAGGRFDKIRGYLTLHFGQRESDRGQYDLSRLVEYAPTCCMLIRKEVFERIGVMDENYFIYSDDADFCLRAKRTGVKLGYLPSAKLLHKVSSLTGGGQSKFAIRHLTRSHIYFIRKNLGFWRSLLYLPAYQVRLLYKLLSGVVDPGGYSVRQMGFLQGCGVQLRTGRVAGLDQSRTARLRVEARH